MVVGVGFLGSVAFRHKLGTTPTWGTEITCRTGDLVRILSESIAGGPAYLADDTVHNAVSLASQAFRDRGDTGNETWSGTIETYLRYRGLDSLIAHAFGVTAGAPTNASGASAAYQQYFRPHNTLETIFGTLCVDKVHNIAEFDSVKINSMTITANTGERVRVSFDVIARDFNNDSTVNTPTSRDLWTDKDTAVNREYIIFEDANVYLDPWTTTTVTDDTAPTITAVDNVYPTSFSITLSNNLVGDYTTRNAPLIDEPIRDGFAEVTGSITFPVFGTTEGATLNGESFEDAMLALTDYALQIDFIGSTIVGSYANEFKMFLPSIEFTSSTANLGGPGKIGHTLNFTAHNAPSAVGFLAERQTTFLYPIWIEIQNRENSNVLSLT